MDFQSSNRRRARLYVTVALMLGVLFIVLLGHTIALPLALLLAVPIFLLAWQSGTAIADVIFAASCIRSRVPALDSNVELGLEHRVLVIVPALLVNDKVVDDLVRALVDHASSTRFEFASFGLLTCWCDSDQEQPSSMDQALLARLLSKVRSLNEARSVPRFFALHRPRRWSEGEGVWMGWERKRGKIEQFNQGILTRDLSSFCAYEGVTDQLFDAKYALVLDENNRLARGTVETLLRAAAHPSNAAVVDENGIVRNGYAILQPAMVTADPGPLTLYQRLFSSSPTSTAEGAFVTYQDIFNRGTFWGKGIYNIAHFDAATRSNLPTDWLLSHDLIEGALAGSGFVHAATVYDPHPRSGIGEYLRRHRWTRGDWQNARWLFRQKPCEGGTRSYRLSALSRYKIADNMRRSVLPLVVAILLFGGFAASSLALVSTTLCVWLLPVLFETALALWKADGALDSFGGKAGPGRFLLNVIARTFWNLSNLIFESVAAAHAVAASAWRMLVTRRRLLQWRTATQVDLRETTLSTCLRMSAPALAVVSSLAASLALWNLDGLKLAFPFLVVWSLQPLFLWLSAGFVSEAQVGSLQSQMP